jgi:putative ubiquitin-RnfH superfamily antitoxin RatB of RatAB toxin-antitoxin module
MAEWIEIEVVHAAVERQCLVSVRVPMGTCIADALAMGEVVACWPELDLAEMPVGIFGKRVVDPQKHILQAGERIEIYRPLLADPMEVRRLRAARAAKDRPR